jgi:hypothetical protein
MLRHSYTVGVSEEMPRDHPPLSRRLRSIAVGLAVVTLLAIIVDGMVRGLDFARMATWATAFIVCLAIAAIITVALHSRRQRGGG